MEDIACEPSSWLFWLAPARPQRGAAQHPDLPPALKPAGLSVYLEVPATGVQIYTCGKNDAGAWAWTFKAPEAALLDTAKKQIGKHYAGPTWEALGGGKVVGAVKANAPAPAAGGNPAGLDRGRRRARPGLRRGQCRQGSARALHRDLPVPEITSTLSQP